MGTLARAPVHTLTGTQRPHGRTHALWHTPHSPPPAHPTPHGSPGARVPPSPAPPRHSQEPSPSISLPSLTLTPHVGPSSKEAPDAAPSQTPESCPGPLLLPSSAQPTLPWPDPTPTLQPEALQEIISQQIFARRSPWAKPSALPPANQKARSDSPPASPLPPAPSTRAFTAQQDSCPQPAQPARLGRGPHASEPRSAGTHWQSFSPSGQLWTTR